MDRETHQRYLDYRERHGYFGASSKMLAMAEFEALDREHATLAALGEARDDDEEQRFEEVAKLLLRD